MDHDALVKGHCKPCEGTEEPLKKEEVAKYLSALQSPWSVIEDSKIERKFKFKNFVKAMKFVNEIADIAESEGHHPDIIINYNRVTIQLTTHAIKGLSENDFIMASKIESISI